MSELKPCPFCGTNQLRLFHNSSGEIIVLVNCVDHSVPVSPERWNTRPIENALRKQLEDARKDSDDEHGWEQHWCKRATKAERQLAIAVEMMNKAYKELISTIGVYSRIRAIDILEDALAEIERLRGKDD